MEQRLKQYVVAWVAALLVGCGSSEETPLQVEGRVAYQGQSVPGGTLLLQPQAGKAIVAVIDPTGRYETLVPAGTYQVGVVASSVIPEGVDPWKPGVKLPPPMVPEKYGRPETSGISVTVAPENTSIDISMR